MLSSLDTSIQLERVSLSCTFSTPCRPPPIPKLHHPTLPVAISANEPGKIPGARRTSGTRKSRPRKTNIKGKWPKTNIISFHTLFTTRKEDSFDVYKDFARWIVHTEHLFISWYAVLDVRLKLDAEDYEDKEEYVQYSHCMHAYHYFVFQVYERFSYQSRCVSTTAQGTPSIHM
jgi:hypothetical protein